MKTTKAYFIFSWALVIISEILLVLHNEQNFTMIFCLFEGVLVTIIYLLARQERFVILSRSQKIALKITTFLLLLQTIEWFEMLFE